MAPEQSEHEREIQVLEAELKRLEAEYNMFFAGRLPRPPWETRTRVTGLFKKFDRAQNTINNYAVKFRFQTLQSRFTSQSISGIAACGRAKRGARARSHSSRKRSNGRSRRRTA